MMVDKVVVETAMTWRWVFGGDMVMWWLWMGVTGWHWPGSVVASDMAVDMGGGVQRDVAVDVGWC
jgi:hypothetical protein